MHAHVRVLFLTWFFFSVTDGPPKNAEIGITFVILWGSVKIVQQSNFHHLSGDFNISHSDIDRFGRIFGEKCLAALKLSSPLSWLKWVIKRSPHCLLEITSRLIQTILQFSACNRRNDCTFGSGEHTRPPRTAIPLRNVVCQGTTLT